MRGKESLNGGKESLKAGKERLGRVRRDSGACFERGGKKGKRNLF